MLNLKSGCIGNRQFFYIGQKVLKAKNMAVIKSGLGFENPHVI